MHPLSRFLATAHTKAEDKMVEKLESDKTERNFCYYINHREGMIIKDDCMYAPYVDVAPLILLARQAEPRLLSTIIVHVQC
jgi:hypothetical protein